MKIATDTNIIINADEIPTNRPNTGGNPIRVRAIIENGHLQFERIWIGFPAIHIGNGVDLDQVDALIKALGDVRDAVVRELERQND